MTKWNVNPFICDFLTFARALLPLVTQLMLVGLPFVKPLSIGTHYQAMIETLADDRRLDQLRDFLGDVKK